MKNKNLIKNSGTSFKFDELGCETGETDMGWSVYYHPELNSKQIL